MGAVSVAGRRARFRELHAADRLFLMPNPWDAGSARLLEALGFEALATTSAGFAWSLGRLDQRVARDELVAHVAALAAATALPLNVDSERCYPGDPGGVAETVRLLGEAGAAGCSIEDYDPATGRIDDVGLAAKRVAEAAEAAHGLPEPMVLTGRCENHIRDVDDLDDTIARLVAYRDAGADCLYPPGLTDLEQIRRVVDAVGAPVNVLALPACPAIGRRAADLDGQPPRGRRLRRTGRGRTRAARHGHLPLRGEARTSRPARRSIRGEPVADARSPRTPSVDGG
jgi:2-methylisocitrate lyase-like PEP mutase family enzyme